MNPNTSCGAERRSGHPQSRIRSVLSSPWTVATTVFAVYGLYISAVFLFGQGAPTFIVLEKGNVQSSHTSSVIKLDPHWPYAAPGLGYDGQAYYFIALDPARARYYLDHPVDRYAKILYPMTARLLAFGQPDLIPYTLILVNWLAVALGTLAMAAWLKRKGLSPWFALAYGLYFGLFFSFARDLVEPLAYAWLALAVYLFDFGGKGRVVWAAICFSLAILTRDKSAVFAVAYAALLLVEPLRDQRAHGWKERAYAVVRGVPPSALLLAISGLPVLIYLAFLHRWLGSVTAAALPTQEQGSPLQGFAHMKSASLLIQTPTVFIPTLILTGLAVWALIRRIWRVEIFLLLATIDLSVVTLNPGYFVDPYGVPRVGISVVLAALLCFPAFDVLTKRNRSWFLLCSSCWVFMTVSFYGFLAAGALV
jgi:hypothetical protein